MIPFERFFHQSQLKFTPLEFETDKEQGDIATRFMLKFTPLEFETSDFSNLDSKSLTLKFTPLEFET